MVPLALFQDKIRMLWTELRDENEQIERVEIDKTGLYNRNL